MMPEIHGQTSKAPARLLIWNGGACAHSVSAEHSTHIRNGFRFDAQRSLKSGTTDDGAGHNGSTTRAYRGPEGRRRAIRNAHSAIGADITRDERHHVSEEMPSTADQDDADHCGSNNHLRAHSSAPARTTDGQVLSVVL